ncbi:ATP-binding cassette domain-containing protein [Bradyrhizobium sp. SSUT112]|uniref:ATP-binding cassette domain-containing protein n=1 Tax=Bradyrhizobium sp. SSUT112 TaxID=3040604 RepID=UPI002448FDEF|nr:ATP-binding cassette domain-containing protein [Bradyrhizobium sp. SSUT112]MDH2350499.1 ATP-binding cassette domain-containing protein [Bradyrhizobium sp. SSUT112]
MIADLKGYFKDEGLAPKLVTGNAGTFGRQTLAAGQVMFAHGDASHPLQLTARGKPCKILLATEMVASYASIVVRKELAGLARAERKASVAKAIATADLTGFGESFPRTLSGGMRQRVALMCTLIMEPEILLMDEPFGALDTHTKLEMHATLLEIWERERQTVLFVTHDLGEALTLASRIILLSARPGRLKDDFDVAFPRPRDPVALRETAEFGKLYSRIWHSLGEEFRRTKADGP